SSMKVRFRNSWSEGPRNEPDSENVCGNELDSRMDSSILEWGMYELRAARRHASSATLLADFYDVAAAAFQISLHSDINISGIVSGDSLHVFQFAGEGGNRLQFIIRTIKKKLSVMTVGDVEGSLGKEDRFGRKRFAAGNDAMQLVTRVEHIQHVVDVVSDVKIAAIVINHALRLRDPVLLAKKFRDCAITRDAKDFVLL